MIALSHYKNRTVAVFGLGKAGAATVASLLAGGARVLAWDDHAAGRDALEQHYGTEVRLTISPYGEWDFAAVECLVLSPGVPLTHPAPHPVVARAKAAGCTILGDIELLLAAQPEARVIGITGTNGKSTTTTLIAHLLKVAGKKVEVGGNLGTPALALAPLGADGVYVIETSSYQLDLLHKARFNSAVFLNITPDHIDRHGDMEGYIAAKRRIFNHQQSQDAAIVAVDDEYTRVLHDALLSENRRRVIAVSASQKLERGVYAENGVLHDCLSPGEVITIDLRNVASLTGRHNWQNAAAAYAAARLEGCAPEAIERGLRSFPGLKHRLELVATLGGVRFINDSKATNADATANALAPFQNIYWILGGKAKEGGIASLAPFFPKIAHAFLIGDAQDAFARTLEGAVPYTRCGTLEKAFAAAKHAALAEQKPGAVVLLSPACASFDQWKNFEERGEAFCGMVRAL